MTKTKKNGVTRKKKQTEFGSKSQFIFHGSCFVFIIEAREMKRAKFANRQHLPFILNELKVKQIDNYIATHTHTHTLHTIISHIHKIKNKKQIKKQKFMNNEQEKPI